MALTLTQEAHSARAKLGWAKHHGVDTKDFEAAYAQALVNVQLAHKEGFVYCDARCIHATVDECQCACQGKNHKAGTNGTLGLLMAQDTLGGS